MTFLQDRNPIPVDFSIEDAIESLSSIEHKIDGLIASGVPAEKMVMGLNFTGFGFTKTTEINDQDGSFDRIYRYNEICGLRFANPRRWKTVSNDTNFSVVRNNDENRAFVMDTSRSIANKVLIVLKRGLAGVAPTTIAFDEFYGLQTIDENTFADFVAVDGAALELPKIMNRQLPLLNTINEVTQMSLDEVKVFPTTKPNINEDKIEKDNTTTVVIPAAEDVKMVCQVYTQSDLIANDITFDYDNFDWNMCTHVITVDLVTGGTYYFTIKVFIG